MHSGTDFTEPLLSRQATVVALILLYVAAISTQWYMTPDSAVYLTLGESLSQGDGYTICGQPHTKFPHGFPMLIAGLTSLGMGGMIWINLAMVVMGLCALWLIYVLVRDHGPQELALPIVLVVGFSYEMFLHSHTPLSDVPFLMLVVLGLWCYMRGPEGGRGWLELGTLVLIAGCWVRVVGAPLAVLAAVGLLVQPGNVRRVRAWANAVFLTAGIAATGLFLYWQFHATPRAVTTASYAAEVSWMTGRSVVSWVQEPILNFFHTGPELGKLFCGQETPAAIAILLFWLPTLFGAWRAMRTRKFVVLFAVAGYLGAILLLRPLMSRYLLPVFPFLLLYFIDGVCGIVALAGRKPARSRVRVALLAVVSVLVLMNVPKDLRLAYWIHREDFVEFRREWRPWVQAAEFLRSHDRSERKFVSENAAVLLARLSRRPCLQIDRGALASAPDPADALSSLKERGVQTIVIDRRRHAHAFFRQLERGLPNSEDFALALETDDLQVYCLCSKVVHRAAESQRR